MSNKLAKSNDEIEQKYIGCTSSIIGKISDNKKDKTRKKLNELSRDELRSRLKGMSVYVLLCIGLGIFIVDGTLYEFCNKVGLRFGFDGRNIYIGIGGTYFVIFVVIVVFFSWLVWKYNFWFMKR